ncbi:hypothetical protein EMIT074MI3_50034 [Bacillus licheniformis]|jgi:hypothetical protein
MISFHFIEGHPRGRFRSLGLTPNNTKVLIAFGIIFLRKIGKKCTALSKSASIFGTKKVLTSAQNRCASLHFYSQDTLPIIIDYGKFI